MKRVLAALLGLAVVAAVVLVLTARDDAPARTLSGPTALQTASLSQIGRPAPPEPKFTRTIFATSTLARSELMLDFCRGPVAVDLGEHRPVLVAEHDYCGGTAWMPKVGMGDTIKLTGGGVEDGTYVVTSIGHGIRGQTRVRELPDTDIVLQTCVTPREMVLVGMDLVEPDAT